MCKDNGYFTCFSLAISNMVYCLYSSAMFIRNFFPYLLTHTTAFGDFFWRCDQLKKLDVSHNRIRALPDCFSDLRRLGTLCASHNYLKELPQSCSWGCINLVSVARGVASKCIAV